MDNHKTHSRPWGDHLQPAGALDKPCLGWQLQTCQHCWIEQQRSETTPAPGSCLGPCERYSDKLSLLPAVAEAFGAEQS